MQSIKEEIDAFETGYAGQMQDAHPSVQLLLQYIAGQKGGRLRPKALLLAAGMTGTPGKDSVRMAVLVELMHQASLIHDDVIDDAATRRNFETVNAVWDNRIAVLLGDYFFSKVFGCLQETSLPGVQELVKTTVERMTQGEICQLSHRGNLDLSEDEYRNIVFLKTASLIETAFRLGAMSVGAPAEQVGRCGSFGRLFGTFFQFKDDLKDYADTSDGKGCLNDMREGEVTLPVIYTMRRLCLSERSLFRQRFLKIHKDDADLAELAGTVTRCGALEQACAELCAMKDELLRMCAGFPDTPYRRDMEKLIVGVGEVSFMQKV